MPIRKVKILAIAMCGAFLASFLTSCSRLPERQWGRCAVIGGAIGAAVVGGSAAGIAEATGPKNDNRTDEAVPAGLIGAVVGGGIGALAGHYLCDPIVQPPVPAPTPPPPPLVIPIPPTPPKEKVVLRGVHFDFNKYNIRPGDAAVLDESAEIIKRHPNLKVEVNGYCDAIGSLEYNLRLSERRADAVASYLEKQGIPTTQLIPRGFGKTDFVAPNETASGRAQNRRVELVPEE